MNALFLQLPVQDSQGDAAKENVPLAAAKLIAYAESRGLGARAFCAILDHDVADYGGDAAICSAVLRARPDIALFHLDSWNLDRSIWIAKRLRALLPATYLAAFGPGAAQGAELLRERAFDALIEGEAELPFIELLKDLEHKALKPRYRAAAAIELDAIPDPYISGILPVSPDKPVIFEASRGLARPLPYRYEPWPSGPVRRAPKDAGPTLLKLASSKDAPGFIILGDALDTKAGRVPAIKALAAANEGGVYIRTELDLSEPSDEEARLWADAALALASYSLPSLHPESLAALGLSLDRDSLEKAIQLYWSQGISLKPELILGLPQESYDTIVDGFDFLGMMGIGQDTELTPLSLLPGSRLRQSAKESGLREFLERPPYWVVETDWMEEDDFLDAIADFEDSFDIALGPAVKPDFKAERAGFISFADLRKKGALDALLVSPERLASSLTLLLDADDEEALRRLGRASKDLRKENPYCLWQLVFYSDASIPDRARLAELIDDFAMPEHYFELSQLYSLDPQPSFQTRAFFCTASEALALQALRERQELETILALGGGLPGPKLLELMPFIAFNKDGTPFELLYDVLSAYREYPELLIEAPGGLF
jgi:hypothetical protein